MCQIHWLPLCRHKFVTWPFWEKFEQSTALWATWKWKIHERCLCVCILYTDAFFCLVLKVKASMTGYDHLLQCLFASWFGLAIAYLRGEARPQLAKFAFFLLLFVKLQHDLLYTLICFFWSNHSTKVRQKKRRWNPSGSWRNPGSPGDFTWHRRKFELLETLRGVGDSPGILSKTWIQVLHL